MKTISTTLFQFDELSEAAQGQVLSRAQTAVYEDSNALDHLYSEMRATAKAVCDYCNLNIRNFSWGPSDRNYDLSVQGPAEDLEGNKAVAWFLKNLMENGYTRPAKFADMQFPGICGFTGTHTDETMVETIWNALLRGESVRHAFDAVAYKFCQMAEAELDYLASEEVLRDMAQDAGEIYTEDGEIF